jgi:hypothetical protein
MKSVAGITDMWSIRAAMKLVVLTFVFSGGVQVQALEEPPVSSTSPSTPTSSDSSEPGVPSHHG